MSSVGVVVPAYRPNVEKLARFVRALDDELAPAVVRIELDDPRPGVVEALRDLPATVHAVDRRRGKGGAITCGFEALDTDVLAFADADGATPADSVARVVERVRDGVAGLAVGSRRHPDADVRSHQTFARRRLGDGFAFLARLLLDAELYDYQCGAKAITADAWGDVRSHLYAPGFAWDVELVAMTAAFDHHVVEVPVTWEDQPESTVSAVPATYELGKTLLVARHRTKRVRDEGLHALLAIDADRPALVDRRVADPEE